MDFDKLNIIIEHNLDFFIGISFMTIPTFTENYILHSGIIYPTSGIYYLIFFGETLAQFKNTYYLCSAKPQQGSLAEWLGAGLQNRLQQFESARNLKKSRPFI